MIKPAARIAPLLTVAAILLAGGGSALGQSATILKMPSGVYYGVVHMPDGSVITLMNITVIEIPSTTPPEPQPAPVDRVTYVYDPARTVIPRPVSLELRKLNENEDIDILASEIDINVEDGTGQTPQQYELAVQTARENGIPILVYESDGKVVQVVKNPTTARDVVDGLEASAAAAAGPVQKE